MNVLAFPLFSRTLLVTLWSVLMLTGCSNLETHTLNIQTAASGTLAEAKQVVALVYAQGRDPDIEKLLYYGGDLTQAIKKIRDRYPKLVPLLDQGFIGLTASGFLAFRDPDRREELRDLLWNENRDRAFLYHRTSVEVGHGSDTLSSWLPYASFSFGHEWITQGHPDWWWMDEQSQWQHGQNQRQ